jgi:hypothetical protein
LSIIKHVIYKKLLLMTFGTTLVTLVQVYWRALTDHVTSSLKRVGKSLDVLNGYHLTNFSIDK